jgi:hypothetical protein
MRGANSPMRNGISPDAMRSRAHIYMCFHAWRVGARFARMESAKGASSMTIERRYRTYKAFSEAFARFDAARRIITWYGTDHHYVIVLRPMKG